MKFLAIVFSFALLQACYCQCLPASAYCLSPPPSLELLLAQACCPAAPACGCSAALAELLPALAPLLASTISSSLAATLPPLLEAALPTVLTSALAAAAPLLAALPAGCACAAPPTLCYAASATPTCIYL